MIDVIKQMVEALEWSHGGEPIGTADAITAGKKLIAELESQEPFEDLATELFVVAQVSPADNGFSETIERIESWLREHFTHPPQRTEQKTSADDFFKMIADRNPKPFSLPQRTWVGLTDEDWKEIENMPDTFDQGVAWAQVKLKEKNS